MNEETLNLSLRKFLKKVGITSQREIEKALSQADASGNLDGSPVTVKVTLECDAFDQPLVIDDKIEY